MAQPLNKIGLELVLDLINRTNTLTREITVDDVQLSSPIALDVEEGLRNTQLTVYPAPGSDYIRSKTVTYWRLDIARLLVGELATVGITPSTVINSTDDIIAILNDRYGLLLQPEDVVFENVSMGEIPGQFVLTMAPGSYGYIGSVNLTFAYSLSEVISINILDGLEYPGEPIIANEYPHYVTEDGNLLTGTGISGAYMTTGDNQEAEIFVGIHRTGAGDPYVTPVDGVYDIPLADDRQWTWSFGAGLIEQNRALTLSEGYNVSLEVLHESGLAMTLLLEEVDGVLVWSIEGDGPFITDNAPTESLLVAQNSQRIAFYSEYFPDLPTNSAGAYLGTFTFTMKAMPKRAVYVKPIEVVVTANITAA